ncbi:hypothetical protein PCC9214_00435 [Planktothrix tepida]|uniref:Uncharacterized protein n=1 Tax=Planktothrix tepida PCC 9214 TaxID=671072 RepID=A0A1J1LDP8_9CYAN|nr:hypothetical protein [Planktothrix tepida]CAD5917404.1 hypothetical protein PCC9214_00435 [Planktothrix tepida]CUR30727.1 hypothetical protein PL9214290318 [Planktothrix tepida PCC 9214]
MSNDILVGAEGLDTLTGGNGNDDFYITTQFDLETITDFQDGSDRIVFTGGLTFAQLQITSENGNTILAVTSTQQQVAKLLGVNSALITAEDFSANNSL